MASQPDISRVLFGRAAAALFAVGMVLTVWAIVLHYWSLDFHHLGQTQLDLLSWGGAIGAVGAGTFFLGMCLFWGTCDVSSPRSHKVWFFILLIGGALPYYFVVYLPAFKRHLTSKGN